jgi:phosphoglycerate dehydrogenase-like enzyme
MSPRRVLVTAPQLQRTIDDHRRELVEHDIAVELPLVVQQMTEESLVALLPGIEGIVAGDDPLTRAVLASADRLRVVSKWGVGIDSIDLAAAQEMGILVTNTPGMFGDEVADVVIGYLILLARQLHRVDQGVRGADWPKPVGVSLAGKVMGIVGLGNIGLAVAKRATSLGMDVVGTDVRAETAELADRSGVKVVALPVLLSEADAISLNCPLTPENRHMIDDGSLATMKSGAWIINTARGGLIDEKALVNAIREGRVGAAALDVFESEPLPADSPLRLLDQVILGAHNASNTAEAVHRTSVRAIENLVAGLDGKGRN